MKKIISSFVCLYICVLCAACNSSPEIINTETVSTSAQTIESEFLWNTFENFSTVKNEKQFNVEIPMPNPSVTCTNINSGLIGIYTFNNIESLRITIVSGNDNNTNNCFSQIFQIEQQYYGSEYEHVSKDIYVDDSIYLGRFKFIRLFGEHTYNYQGKLITQSFSMYITTIPNETSLCWMITDITSDQSCNNATAIIAYKMAEGLKVS